MKHALTIALVLLAAPLPLRAQWVRKSDMNRRRGEHANAVVNGKIYVLGGIHDHTSGPAEVERYDPATDTWTDVSVMPFSRHHFTSGAAVNGSELWVCGGKNGGGTTGVTRVDVYDAAANTWRRGPDLPEVHWGGPAVIVGGKLHVLTGAQGNTVTVDHHFVLDLSNEGAGWSSAKAVPAPRVHVAGVALGGKIYLLGGEYHHSHDGDTTTVQVYDPGADTWDLSKAPLPRPRSHSEWATFTHDGKIWSVSGVDSSQSPRGQENIFVYDPAVDAWTEFSPALPGKLVSPGARIVGTTLYVFGGGVNDWFSGDLVTTWSYDLGGTGTTPASPPSGLTAVAVSASRVDLSWTDNSDNESGFRIERSTGGGFSLVTTTGADVRSYSDTGLAASTQYTYRVRANSADGNSSWSNTASATTLAGAPSAPAAPSGLTAVTASDSAIDLSWTDNSGDETGFQIERSTGGAFTLVVTTGAEVTSFTDTGLVASTAYTYRVKSTNAGGDSAWSNSAEATTLSAPAPTPTPAPAESVSSEGENGDAWVNDKCPGGSIATVSGPWTSLGLAGPALLLLLRRRRGSRRIRKDGCNVRARRGKTILR